MGFPRIKDRLFSQSKNRVFFYDQDHTKWTDSKSLLFVLPQKTPQCSVALMYTYICVFMCESHIHLMYELGIFGWREKVIWCFAQKHKRRQEEKVQAISIYSFNSLANKAWWREGTLCTVTMRALYQPPTLGTINISVLSDTHCMWASLALTPTAERNNELLKNMKQQRGGGRARTRQRLTNFI